MSNDPPASVSNRLLARLSPDDLELLGPLAAVDLPLRTQLERPNRRIDSVYFIERGIASVVANGSSKGTIEVGLIGREGVTGLAVIMAADQSPYDTYMQTAGSGLRLASDALRSAMKKSATLSQALLRYGHAYVVQIAQTALVNGRSKMEDRVARRLLMAQDRMGANEIPLTHEFLAAMLGVRRPGVTIALNLLENSGLIQTRRGIITILDRKGLVQSANGAYGASEAEFRRLFAEPA